tara:strand:+ start:15879 stop:17432 length:1554 start_codon:yes stop_codon:yes gene_type:complete
MTDLYSQVNDNTPVLVGCSEYLDKKGIDGLSYSDILKVSCEKALEDCEASIKVKDHLDTISVIRFTADTPNRDSATTDFWGYSNMPRTLGNALGVKVPNEIYTTTGGNSPQLLLNEICNRIKDKKIECALLTGGEALDTFVSRLKEGLEVDWGDDPGGEPESLGSLRDLGSEFEKKHGIFDPSSVYPLFANSIRSNEGKNVIEHQEEIGNLFSRFSEIASKNEFSWFKNYRSVQEIVETTLQNRMVGFPYTKYMNSIIRVNQSAALVIMSAKKAKTLKIPYSKWIFLHGAGSLNDIWNITDRENLHSSPAIRKCSAAILSKAGLSQADVSFFDLYSCFPSAVQIAKKEIGIPNKDLRDLTVTGGLPYYGGPGSAYVVNSIASMMNKLRSNQGTYGMVNANGWFLTKHGLGLFSSKPFLGEWNQVIDSSLLQKEIDSQKAPELVEQASGVGYVETYTVVNSREGPTKAIIIGRLEDGRRFLANTKKDPNLLERMMKEEMLNIKGSVKYEDSRNVFHPV